VNAVSFITYLIVSHRFPSVKQCSVISRTGNADVFRQSFLDLLLPSPPDQSVHSPPNHFAHPGESGVVDPRRLAVRSHRTFWSKSAYQITKSNYQYRGPLNNFFRGRSADKYIFRCNLRLNLSKFGQLLLGNVFSRLLRLFLIFLHSSELFTTFTI